MVKCMKASIFLLFLFLFPSVSFSETVSYTAPVDAECVAGLKHTNLGYSPNDGSGLWVYDYDFSETITTVYSYNPPQFTDYELINGLPQLYSSTGGTSWSRYAILYAAGSDKYLTLSLYGQLDSMYASSPFPWFDTLTELQAWDCVPDPCDDSPDPDGDSDGLCDRCDFYPDDAMYGRNMYGYAFYTQNDGLEMHHVDVGYKPYRLMVNIGASQDSDHTFTINNDNQTTQDPTWPIELEGSVLAQMSQCVCEQPCEWVYTPAWDNLFTPDVPEVPAIVLPEVPVNYPGSEPLDGVDPIDPFPSPTNLNVPDIYFTPDVGDFGEAGDPSATPETGTDNEILANIATNIRVNTENLKVLTDVTDNRLSNIEDAIKASSASEIQSNQNLIDAVEDIDLDMTIDTGQTASDIVGHVSSFEAGMDTTASSLETTITDEIDSLITNSPMDDSLWSGVWENLIDVFPAPTTCQPLVVDIPPNIYMELGCEQSDAFKAILSFVIAFYTIFSVVQLIFIETLPKT